MYRLARTPHLAVLVLVATAGGCGKSRGGKAHVPMDAEAPRPPLDAPRVRTAAERDALYSRVPTDQAIAATIKRIAIAPHPAGTPANAAVGQELLATLGRLGVRTGIAEESVLMPSFAGAMLVLELKPRPIRNILAIFEGDSTDAILVGTTFDATDTTVASHANTAALLEIARGYAALQRAGWRPHRTIILAFWDGGTIGDQGISAWVEQQHTMLATSAIAYLDIGPLGGGPALFEMDPLLRTPLKLDDLDGILFSSDTTAPAAPAVREGIPTVRWVTTDHVQPDDAVVAAAGHVAREAGLAALHLAELPATPLDYEGLANSLSDDISIRTFEGSDPFAPDDTRKFVASLDELRRVAPDVTGPVAPECERALVSALRAFVVEDGNPGHRWYRSLRVGIGDADGTLRSYPEVFAAHAAQDPALLHRAATRLIKAVQRASIILAPCATTTSR